MKPAPLALAAALLMQPMAAVANIQQQVDEMFNGMINTTTAGSYKTATRGVITGGSVVLRNRLSTANLISITPPSAKGGCGGINLYSGSFSFINGEEFVALMRNIASNASGVISGFAFELALDAMDAQTGGVIRNLANKIQSLNQMFSNSCQLASGLVTNAKKAFEESGEQKSAMTAFVENVATDFFGAKSIKEDSPASRIASAGKAVPCNNTGNVIWCAMQKSGLRSQFLFGSDENAEFIMSMVGSYNVRLKTDDKGGKNFASDPLQKLITNQGLKILVQGSSNLDVDVYDCDDEACVNPAIRPLTAFKGLESLIIDDLQSNGVLERFAHGTATAADGKRIEYLASSRVGVNLMLITQKAGAQSGYDYLAQFAKKLAADAAQDLIIKMLGEAEKGLSSLDMVDAEKVLNELRATKRDLVNEHRAYVEEAMQGKDADAQAEKMLLMTPALDSGSLPQGSVNSNAGS